MANFTFSKSIYKSLLLLVLLITCTISDTLGQSFITTWNTANPGTSNVSSITIPTGEGAFNYDVDWNNDGVFDEFGLAGGITHDFGMPGIYTIRIQGDFPSIFFNNAGDKLKITEINQWGTIAWGSMKNAFYGCSNIVSTAADSPNFSNTTDISSMFRSSGITGNINGWDVSNVTDMSFMFSFAPQFNSDISNWNVSEVTNMRGLFWGATLFNQPLNSWDVSKVTDMSLMFFFAESFNQNLIAWDVSQVTNMSSTFSFASLFNGDIGGWNVSSVAVMASMFSAANAFDQNLGNWNIKAVTDMTEMLSNTSLSLENYDNTLMGWEGQVVKPNVPLGANGLNYCEGESARNSLIALDNWNIVGDSKYCPYFITTWNTGNPGVSNATSITIPTVGEGYNYDVDWDNDGIFDQVGINGDVTHDFGVVGNYTIQIRGDFPRIYFDNTGDKDKIIDINQWGNIEWTDMSSAFYGCSNLSTSATDAPDLSNVTSMGSMFQLATKFNGDISTWDVSNVTQMGFMFHSASLFNQNINGWDVSNVTNMNRMFYFASAFNSHLNNWDVSSAIDMSYMFQSATSFNKNISIWHVDNVTNMSYMFKQADAFNHPLNTWNVSKVTNMSRMFSSANVFNQNLGDWDISNVQNMEDMLSFSGLSAANYDATLIGWGSQTVQNGVAMGAHDLTYCEGDAARSTLVNSFGWTITGDSKSCSFITTWKTDNPGASPNDAITIPVTGGGYNYDVDWNNDGVFDQLGINGGVSHIFGAPGTYTIRIRGDFPRIYFNAEGDKDKLINIDQWGDIEWTSMGNAFDGCKNLIITAADVPNLHNVTDLTKMFKGANVFNSDISNWDVSNVTVMREMFRQASIFNSDISNWDVSNVTDMSLMFTSAFQFNSDISNWDVSNVSEMQLMFLSAETFNQDIGSWNVSNVIKMNSMFASAISFNQDLSNWDVSNVTTMGVMFYHADEFNGDISTWNVSNVTYMSIMFSQADKFTGDISNWDVSNVTSMATMFHGADLFNGNIGNWDVSSVTTMKKMFQDAVAFDQDLGDWNITSVTTMEDMLSGSALSTESYDNTLIGWVNQNVHNNVDLGALDLTYCAGKASRAFLINVKNWNIIGDMNGCAPFITTWKTDNPGDSPNNAITIPVTGGGYNYDVDWNNDGIYDQLGINGSVSHIFPAPGTYTIRIRGDFPRIYFNFFGDREKIINIEQWGDIKWSSMSDSFAGCKNLIVTATDAPNLSNVTDLHNMFSYTAISNNDLNNWDVSNITNVSWLFEYATNFNGDISNWDVSNVTDMQSMFYNATSFNGDISNWNVSNVTEISHMFSSAIIFNQDLSNWDVSNVTSMLGLFSNAQAFNGDLNNWDVTKVKKMWYVFDNALSFNGNISNWDVSNATSLSSMFHSAHSFNGDISNWNVSNVTSMHIMFRNAYAFNRDLSNWDVSNVHSMDQMFFSAYAFNSDISNWDVSSVTNMEEMFHDATSFNQDLGNWNISSVTTMKDMLSGSSLSRDNYDNTLIGWSNQNVIPFVSLGALGLTYCNAEAPRSTLLLLDNWIITGDMKDCDAFITKWKTDNPGASPDDAITIPVIGDGYNYDVDWNNDGVFDQFGINGSVSHIFPAPGTYAIRIRGDFPRMYFKDEGDKEKIIDIEQWGDVKWSSMNRAFEGCVNLNSTATDAPDLSNVTDLSLMFYGAEIFNGDVSNWDVSNVTNMSWMFGSAKLFNSDISNWDVSKVINMSSMFYFTNVFNSDLSNWDVSNVTNMYLMFYLASSFNSDISNWDVSKVTDISGMFISAKDFNQDLNNWDVSNVTNMIGTFQGAEAFNCDLNNWDVSNVTLMWNLFTDALSFNGDISNWDVSNVTNMRLMFFDAHAFTGDLSNWDVSNATNMKNMFERAGLFDSDISVWEVANVTNMEGMFHDATSFNQNLGNWDISSVTSMEEMLSGSALSTENYDNTLIGWSNQNVIPFVSLGALGLTYCNAVAPRSTLLILDNWIITGDNLDCGLPVEIIFFDAKVNGKNHVDLQWSTASEINNDYFTIERSRNGIQFEELMKVPGAGNSVQINSYTIEDTNPFAGLSYYRLKQTDFDGTIFYTEIRAVNIDSKNGFKAFPNPMQEVLHVVNDGSINGPVSIEIFDALGKSQFSKQLTLEGENLTLDINEVSDFESGNYFMIVREGDSTHSIKLTKVHD